MKPALIPFAVLVAIQLTCVQVNIPQIPELCRRCLQPIGSLIARGIKKMSMRSSSFWDDDYLFIGWAGEIMNKRERLSAIRSGAFQVQSVESDEVIVRVFKDVALLYRRINSEYQQMGREAAPCGQTATDPHWMKCFPSDSGTKAS